MIDVEGATKRYRTVTAVNGVSLQARPGEVTALLGPNGAGKTSLLRMIVGMTRPDGGRVAVEVEGRPARSWELGYLPEERGLFKGVTLARTLRYFARLQGLSRQRANRVTSEWLNRLSLAERAGDKVETLSRGNQQKVQLAAALLHEPKIAILDEPFSGLDPVNQELFIGLIRDLARAGVTVVMSAHEMSLVERVADRVVLIVAGRVALDGSLGEVTAGRSLHELYVSTVQREVAA